jgi:MarR family transcriptional regulator, transcriptional regulator for hemolysin
MEEPPDETRLDLSFLLNQAAYAFEAHLAEALAEHGLSVREYCVLWKAEEAERTQQEIAELAGLDKSTLVLTLDRLEERGLVQRRVSDIDRRARVVAVTPRGGGLYSQAQAAYDKVTVETLRPLGATGMHAFVRGLQGLVEGEGPLAAPSHVRPARRKQVRRRQSARG